MKGIVAPPSIARALLWLSLPAAERESIPGDLEEELVCRVASGASVSAARQWYCRQVWRSFAPLLGTCWRRAEIQEEVVLLVLAFGVPIPCEEKLKSWIGWVVEVRSETPDRRGIGSRLTIVMEDRNNGNARMDVVSEVVAYEECKMKTVRLTVPGAFSGEMIYELKDLGNSGTRLVVS